ncbi:U2 snRNP auxiliary factor large subunit, partial [Haematococcus lacustris]
FSAAPQGFSAAPPGVPGFAPAPPTAAFPGGFSAPGALPPPPVMGFTGGVPGFPNMTSMPSSMPPSQQATRHARRVYVGGLPPTAVEQTIAVFFSSALAAIGGNSAGPGNAVVNVYINKEKNFAFVEFRTVEETSNAMALDGIMFEGVSVRVRRPNDYNPAAAAALGPSAPNPTLNLAAIGLGSGRSGPDPVLMGLGSGLGSGLGTATVHRPHPDGENRIFCRELLGSFGAIKSFELIKDKDTGMGKGYGFVTYADPKVTDIAVAGLNGLKMGERTLTVRRAEPPGGGLPAGITPLPGMAPISLATPSAPTFVSSSSAAPAAPVALGSRVVVLQEAVTVEELKDDEEYKDIIEDMREECSKHGALKRVIIPRPTASVPNPPGVAKVIIEYDDMASALRARNAMHGRKFGGRTVVATYLPEDKYLRGAFDG